MLGLGKSFFFVSPISSEQANITKGDVSLRATKSQVTQSMTGQTDGQPPPPEPHPVQSAVLEPCLHSQRKKSN